MPQTNLLEICFFQSNCQWPLLCTPILPILWRRSRRWMWDMRFFLKIIQSKQSLGCLIKGVPYMYKNTKNSYNSYSFYLISLALCCTLVTYINRQKKRLHHIYFGTVKSLIEIFFMGQSKLPITKENKIELWGSLQLINMKYNILP